MESSAAAPHCSPNPGRCGSWPVSIPVTDRPQNANQASALSTHVLARMKECQYIGPDDAEDVLPNEPQGPNPPKTVPQGKPRACPWTAEPTAWPSIVRGSPLSRVKAPSPALASKEGQLFSPSCCLCAPLVLLNPCQCSSTCPHFLRLCLPPHTHAPEGPAVSVPPHEVEPCQSEAHLSQVPGKAVLELDGQACKEDGSMPAHTQATRATAVAAMGRHC